MGNNCVFRISQMWEQLIVIKFLLCWLERVMLGGKIIWEKGG